MYVRSLVRTLQRCRSLTAGGVPAAAFRGATAAVTTTRGAHTDLPVPDFSAYRNSYADKPNEASSRGELGKRAAAYMVVGGVSTFLYLMRTTMPQV